jgi:hypothetical protein
MSTNLSALAENFKKSRISRREFLKETCNIIISIPNYLGYYDADIRHEFFAYIASKITRIISMYQTRENSQFISWFSITLKRQFYNFISQYNKQNSIIEFIYSDTLENYNSSSDDNLENINLNLSILSHKEKRVLSLKYGMDKDTSYITRRILSKIDKKKKMEETLNKKFFKLLMIQRNIIAESEKEKINVLKQKESLLKKGKRKLEKSMNRISILPSNKWVAKKMGISEGCVASYINRIRIKLIRAGINNIAVNRYE